MKKLSIMIMALALVLGMAQCKKQTEQQSNEPAGATMDVTVRVQGNTEKTDITLAGVVTWKQGDKLYVVGESQGLLGYVSARADGDPATFSGSITALTSAQTLRFYYVGDKSFTLDGDDYTFDLGSQDGSLAGIAANNQLMFGKTADAVSVGTIDFGTIEMTSLMSIAHLNINGGGAAVAGPVTVTGGFATSTFNAKTYDGTTLPGTAGNITMTFAEGTTSTDCYLALLPGTQTLKFSADGKVATLAAKDIVANTFYNSGSAVAVETIPDGALPGLFSVSDTKQVYFSQGNLQYIGSAAAPYWKFADHQFDFLGSNGQGSTSQTADRDLFGFGTSGYNHGATCYQPWSTSSTNNQYYAYGSWDNNLEDGPAPHTGMADWGKANAISNGGNQAGKWRTLTGGSGGEWAYLLNTRTTATTGLPNASSRYAKVTVNGVSGMLLFPDSFAWTSAMGTAPTATNSSSAAYTTGSYTVAEFTEQEKSGVVFLPAAGFRGGTSVSNVGSYGGYWSSSYSNSSSAYILNFRSGSVLPSSSPNRCNGFSVRLVSEN